ncbi:MAG: cyclic beta 1-2 glucan synthetase [Bacteroidetes bacterium]|nr:MAG: cyclic beta 1-2 glucan synthetase [Bacteroidota bacterium]
MKLIPSAHELISNMRAFFRPQTDSGDFQYEEPLRAELYGSGQMERFGKKLAASHVLSTKPAKDHLLKRLADNETVLHMVRKLLTNSIKKSHQLTPAGEWLIDNFYLIEEDIRNAKLHFPKGYSEDLPQLTSETDSGPTRIYDIALNIISHSDGRVDIDNLSSFIKSYQTVNPLQLGELWAIPIMLHLALIENLRRVAARIAMDRIDANLADFWVKQLMETVESLPKNLILVIADMARSSPPMSSAFVSELTRQLRGQGPDLALVLNWMEQQLIETGKSSAELVNMEVQKQAADQVSMSNSIGSIRVLSAMDWRDFIEAHSVVEQTLRQDHEGVYGSMDFATRDRYRHVVEGIAKKSKLSEQEVAQIAIELMQENLKKEVRDVRASHVGYFLIDKGVAQTRQLARMRMSAGDKLRTISKVNSLKIYFASIFIVTSLITGWFFVKAYSDTQHYGLLITIFLLSVLCASQLAISLVNFFATLLVKPHLLPRMDFSKEIPKEYSTMVIIPAMLTNTDEVETLVESLEVRFLANRNKNLHFGLLTDFTDATEETRPGDDLLISLAREKIVELNNKYTQGRDDLFYLFHRPRRWNPSENAWMGYERKRGKLSELNSLLRGRSKDRFSIVIGDQSVFPSIKYVITLDADTQLPLNSAWKLVGTMAHPLNHPRYSERKKRITQGYGILQPRVSIHLPDTDSSLYARMHGNEPGLDPYTRASSDVYQDLFGEGSFIGKGIYEVDTFIKVLDGKFSENKILSHDLLEGCYIRSGLVSDVNLFEKYPESYAADMKRISRWVRGDWQIFSWFLPIVPAPGRQWVKNPISILSRWKILDNIRRSLVPFAITVLILLGWLVLPSTLFWTLVVTGIIIFPIFISSTWAFIRKPEDVNLLFHLQYSWTNIENVFVKTLYALICLPYEAYSNLKSIFLALWRMLVSRKKLLEWSTASQGGRGGKMSLMDSYSSMWIEPVLALIVIVYLSANDSVKLFLAGPILFMWSLAPLITLWSSQPSPSPGAMLSDKQVIFLRKVSRRTWSYFERFIDAKNNYLPPDNYQEQPAEQLANRTSPTNIGLSLLSNLSAFEFGYITSAQLLERTSLAIGSMKKLEQFRGHFYNWYDTESLNPLLPKYISTVDSGNLVGHLLVLKQGLLAIPEKEILSEKLFTGIQDTFRVLCDSLDKSEQELVKDFSNDLKSVCELEINSMQELIGHGFRLKNAFASIFSDLNSNPDSETSWWKEKLMAQLETFGPESEIFKPWLTGDAVPEKFRSLLTLNVNVSLVDLKNATILLQNEIKKSRSTILSDLETDWLDKMSMYLEKSTQLTNERLNLCADLAQSCSDFADMEWDFLYDKSSHLFTIGYNVQDNRMDPGFYDLLASENRLAVFTGIAQGKIPEDSWFALGRLLTNVNGKPILLSWSGSMFEYLMPLLVMPTYDNTLLDQTGKAAVQWQIEYGKQKGLPWGISESGYNMVSANLNYQYRAFGAPGLGLKRGLEEDSVVAPYASAMALMVEPEKACSNLEFLSEKGFEGRHGFYEAIDYTPSRLPRGQSSATVFSFMAHHQGMSLLSLAYLLLDKPMQKLFEAEPQFKAVLLLLQERIPKATTFFAHTTDAVDINQVTSGKEMRVITTPNTPTPEVQLLSNGKYHVMLTNSGGGYSKWKNLDVVRWREDITSDNWGTFLYIRDLMSGEYWSATHQPTLKRGDGYEAVFSQGRADFRSTNNELLTRTEVVVSPEDDIEMRRYHITNNSTVRRSIDVTSYAEVVLASAASDVIQPAFSNLFVQTEILPEKNAIICTRRPRSVGEHPPWMFHLMTVQGKDPVGVSFETDRMEFIGRGNSVRNPHALQSFNPLSGKHGSVLDPIVSIRYYINLEPGETVTIDMLSGVADTKEHCLSLVNKYRDKHHKDRIFELAWTHSQVVLRQINAPEADAQLYARLASPIIFTNSAFRAEPSVLINNHRGQSGLWGYSISGDLPIVLLKIEKQSSMLLVKQLVQAHSFWRLKGLMVDLVIWNEERTGYRQDFQHDLLGLIPAELVDRPGGVFIRAADQISSEDRILFQTVARINISDLDGTLAEHVKRKQVSKVPIPKLVSTLEYKSSSLDLAVPDNLQFFNGLGGFSPDGTEYVIIQKDKKHTPTPWVNVIANPDFGTIISESGTAYTWVENAHESRLTPWRNDPVSNSGGEAFYIRDEETTNFWSVTSLPKPGAKSYITRHGFGYSVFEHIEDGIYTEMTVFVDIETSIKFNVIKIKNLSGKTRKLSATGYVEWVLGDNRIKNAMYVHTELDPLSSAILAKNPYNTEFARRVAFFDTDDSKKTYTADRTEFLGRNGSLENPDAMSRQKLSGRLGLALDPCTALQVSVELQAGEEKEVIFRLGAGRDQENASYLAYQFRGTVAAQESLTKVKDYWKKAVGAIKVETPDPAINIITNGWLNYQTLASRIWGRSGFYQSGGAYGFRDQLQDVMSLLHAAPQLARKQILLSASRQFKEGDVQHWWHPPMGRGVRTRCSDDYLWLPLVTSVYISHTGDSAILDESVNWLEGRQLNEGEESYYDLPVQSFQSAKLYEHCVMAIRNGFKYGERGLPLIGTGDWNDGFDRVGEHGKGESVWMAFFLYDILIRFADIARNHRDESFATECLKEAAQLKENVDKAAWDGNWYKRAWFDDGTPLGSSINDECMIDSISQSWSVLSQAGEPSRANKAMESAYKHLVEKEFGIIKLLEPPFDKSEMNPGYIKGYVHGVRENGGQYSHAAVWMIMAFAKLGDKKRVWELLNMINPINHGNSPETISMYKVEPYVLAADIYACPPHEGRGGWTWYTGSASWMYRLVIESFLGMKRESDRLSFTPCIPEDWASFVVEYRFNNSLYRIVVKQESGTGESRLLVDNVLQTDDHLKLKDDKPVYDVELTVFTN